MKKKKIELQCSPQLQHHPSFFVTRRRINLKMLSLYKIGCVLYIVLICTYHMRMSFLYTRIHQQLEMLSEMLVTCCMHSVKLFFTTRRIFFCNLFSVSFQYKIQLVLFCQNNAAKHAHEYSLTYLQHITRIVYIMYKI